MIKIVFDMGATNTRVALVDAGKFREVLKRPTPENMDEWAGYLLTMISEVTNGEEANVIVGGVASVRGFEILTKTLPHARIYNDALMAGLGEAVYGAGKDRKVVGYIGMGTGIGTARISERKIESPGFEAGHHIVDSADNKTWEELVSGRTIKEKHGKYPQELEKSTYDDYVRRIAVGVYNSILFWSPDTLIMGGSLINEKDGFSIDDIRGVVEEINEALPIPPPILKSELGDNAGLYGAMAIIENEVK